MKRLILGLLVTVVLVFGSSLLTWRTTGVSYDHFTWAAYALPMMYPDHEDEVPGGCSDGIDNDLDGDIDCADSDCADALVCNAPVPVISVTGIATLMVLLTLVGLMGLLRLRRQAE